MKESHMKGVASHHSPESCLDGPQGRGEALTGESTGAALSSEITPIRRQTPLDEGECTIRHAAKARPLISLGAAFNLRQFSSVSSVVQKMLRLCAEDKKLRARVQEVETKLLKGQT